MDVTVLWISLRLALMSLASNYLAQSTPNGDVWPFLGKPKLGTATRFFGPIPQQCDVHRGRQEHVWLIPTKSCKGANHKTGTS